ncbi:hypothetical protein [Phenylobacterium sp.]|jgi:hypothetical protein|uniref:hypothetical protein n=1 Tax=Phenylobacterium sp. TaxID=1871053 RepID=UPI002F954454
MRIPLLGVGLCLALAAPVSAQEPMATAGASGAPPAAEAPAPIATQDSDAVEARAIGDWANRVLAGQPSAEAPSPGERTRCHAHDGKPHGEVWAGVGTRGYRSIGGVVTQPLGKCGSLTVGLSHTESDLGRRRR